MPAPHDELVSLAAAPAAPPPPVPAPAPAAITGVVVVAASATAVATIAAVAGVSLSEVHPGIDKTGMCNYLVCMDNCTSSQHKLVG